MKVSIGQAAKELGVSRETLRRWEAEGKISVERTPKGHRRYDLAQLRGLTRTQAPPDRLTIAYARVKSPDQAEELKRQVALLESYCANNGWTFEVIEDFGSGMNSRKGGLRQLIRRICKGDVGRLVVTHQDRLLRFGAELVFALCENFGTEVVIINAYMEPSCEEDLVEDIQEMITLFSARLYGSRNLKNKEILHKLEEAVKDLTLPPL